MTTIAAVKRSSQINDEEFREISQIIFRSFIINGEYKSHSYISKKEILLNSFSEFIEQYLKLNFSGSKENKVRLIKFISKLKMQKELLELASGETSWENIQTAGERLGRKSQSAFKTK